MNEANSPRKEVDVYNIRVYNIGFMVIQLSKTMIRLFKYWIDRCYNTYQDI